MSSINRKIIFKKCDAQPVGKKRGIMDEPILNQTGRGRV